MFVFEFAGKNGGGSITAPTRLAGAGELAIGAVAGIGMGECIGSGDCIGIGADAGGGIVATPPVKVIVPRPNWALVSCASCLARCTSSAGRDNRSLLSGSTSTG